MHHSKNLLCLVIILYMLVTISLARYNSFGEGHEGDRMKTSSSSQQETVFSSPTINQDSEPTPTGAVGSAHGPNWDYGWGWGAGPRSGWGYGYGSSHAPTGFARGYGFGYGSGSGSGSGYGYGTGGGGASGYGYGAGGAHGGSGGGGGGSPSNHHG
ncbi:glycine-rich cell wall structural protein 2 [Beta vulgaris subsp. vulgaris]|uniref:glycine-rich cell wall structural protein 2 n=1 Tax=Beta vulgaris subsp. vulgaris TaxID=3555 RepID=UPI00053F3C49|nr:glycine-rich cell wall structural protein 2 [Beta vulgaris subsp. vulgaris]